MIDRILVSWQLVRASMRILRHDTDLLIFPALIVMGVLFILAIFGVVILQAVGYDLRAAMDQPMVNHIGVWFLFYLVVNFIVFFANAGIVGAVMIYLDGKQPTLRDSWDIARARVGSILGYAFIMATVGVILRLIVRRTGPPGRLAVPILQRIFIYTLLGLAWNLVPLLVVPILVMENLSPGAALRRSATLIRSVWGEQVVGFASTTLIFLLAMSGIVSLATPALYWAVGTLREPVIIAVFYMVIMVVLVLFLVKLALDSIFSALVYRYAVDLPLGDLVDPETMQHAFRAKQAGLLARLRRRLTGRSAQESSADGSA